MSDKAIEFTPYFKNYSQKKKESIYLKPAFNCLYSKFNSFV